MRILQDSRLLGNDDVAVILASYSAYFTTAFIATDNVESSRGVLYLDRLEVYLYPIVFIDSKGRTRRGIICKHAIDIPAAAQPAQRSHGQIGCYIDESRLIQDRWQRIMADFTR